MNKIYLKILSILFFINLISGQELMILSPEHLAINNATAGIGRPMLSNSGLAQAYYNDFSGAGFSLYLPYSQLTDGRISTNALQFYLPTYPWGTLNLTYADNAAHNLDNPVYSNKKIQLGFAKNLHDRFILATTIKWHNYTWYSEYLPEMSATRYSADLSLIYILGGYSSIGMSVENLYRSANSSVKGDGEPRIFRVAYNRTFNSDLLSLESGFILKESSDFNYRQGGFISTIINFPNAFTIGTEYKYLQYHDFGAFVGFIYKANSFRARISYGMRFDNSPLPMSSFRHAFGVQFRLKKPVTSKKIINPQILLRDNEIPFLSGQRISGYTILKKADESDILRIVITAKDKLAGISDINMEIASSTDSSDILYAKSIKNINRLSYQDTLTFDGQLQENRFLDNGKYHARISARDMVGNRSKTTEIPFQLMAGRNDSEGPFIEMEFDTASVNLGKDVKNYVISAELSISDKEYTPLSWQVALYRSLDDSTWVRINTKRGGVQLNNQMFRWSLNRKPLTGTYKVNVEASDFFENKTVLWSPVKHIIQEITSAPASDTTSISDQTEALARESEPEVMESKTDTFETATTEEKTATRFIIETSYAYRGKIVELNDFIMESGRPFNTYLNSNGLHIIGLYLQDMPKSTLTVQSSKNIFYSNESKNNLLLFLDEVYGISVNRINFEQTEEKNSLHFLINEQ